MFVALKKIAKTSSASEELTSILAVPRHHRTSMEAVDADVFDNNNWLKLTFMLNHVSTMMKIMFPSHFEVDDFKIEFHIEN